MGAALPAGRHRRRPGERRAALHRRPEGAPRRVGESFGIGGLFFRSPTSASSSGETGLGEVERSGFPLGTTAARLTGTVCF